MLIEAPPHVRQAEREIIELLDWLARVGRDGLPPDIAGRVMIAGIRTTVAGACYRAELAERERAAAVARTTMTAYGATLPVFRDGEAVALAIMGEL